MGRRSLLSSRCVSYFSDDDYRTTSSPPPMLPGWMGRRSLLSSRCVSHRQGQLAATRQMVPTWRVPPPPTASLRWLDRGWLGAPAIRRPGRRQVVGSNRQRLWRSPADLRNGRDIALLSPLRWYRRARILSVMDGDGDLDDDRWVPASDQEE